MKRYFYETAEDLRGRWFVYDRMRGYPDYGRKSDRAVAMCFNRDDAERIVEALNIVVDSEPDGA
jgi:hypothetical protein